MLGFQGPSAKLAVGAIISLLFIYPLLYNHRRLMRDGSGSLLISERNSLRTSKIAKVTLLLNVTEAPYLNRAVETHEVHNKRYGYQHFIGTTPLVSKSHDPYGIKSAKWTKPAYLLAVMLDQLRKAKVERLEWLFWFDADTIIVNPFVGLHTFMGYYGAEVPDTVSFLISYNWDGLNSGAFAMRVNEWSLSLLSAWLSYRTFIPQPDAPFEDQSALNDLLYENSEFKENWKMVPPHWFNSFPVNSATSANGTWLYGEPLTPELMDNGEQDDQTQPWKIRKGDMLIHFAGVSERESWMNCWATRAEEHSPEWSGPRYEFKLREEVRLF